MPMSDGSGLSTVQVRPSAPLELMWVVHDCEASHELSGPLSSLEALRQKLGPRLKSFWGDGIRGFTEAMVLAQRSGAMFDLDLDRFFAGLDAAAEVAGEPSLLSEAPADRRLLYARLERLRREPGLRSEYAALLRSAWKPMREEWETVGKPADIRTADEWERRLNAGAGYRELLERPRVWPGRPELEDLADAAAAEGQLVLTPGWFFGVIHVVEIDGTLYLGRRVRAVDAEAERREVARKVAGTFRALADPTRLAIVLWVAKHPSSVTEIARHFKLSQPTVSAHVHMLREAELVDEKPSGRSSTLTVTERRLKEMLDGVEESLLRLVRPAD